MRGKSIMCSRLQFVCCPCAEYFQDDICNTSPPELKDVSLQKVKRKHSNRPGSNGLVHLQEGGVGVRS